MARRRSRWIGMGLLLVVLLSFGAWRILREIPGILAQAEDTIRREAQAVGLRVSFRNLRFHPLHLRLTLESLVVEDSSAGTSLVHAEHVEASLSPRRILTGLSPVSRIRVRRFFVRAGRENLPLLDRFKDAGKGGKGGGGSLPEILLHDGKVVIGPIGPVEHWEAGIPEARIRPVRFLGSHVTLSIRGSAGRIGRTPGEEGNIPVDSAEADFFLKGNSVRIRKLRVSGPPVELAMSGAWDVERGKIHLKCSGEADIGGWLSIGAPGSEWLSRVATSGTVAFSSQLDGIPGEPRGSGKIAANDLLLAGGTPGNATVSFAVSGRTLRVESLRGNLWGGTVTGSGSYDFRAEKGDAEISVARAEFGKAPWGTWGYAWRPAGRGDVVVSISGGRRKVVGTFSLDNPAGVERTGEGSPARIALPVSARAEWDFLPGKATVFRDFRLRAGKAEVAGSGRYDADGGNLSFAGKFLVPGGRAAEYGWSIPVSWKRLSGELLLSGSSQKPRVAASAAADGLVARSLPPVSLAARLEGDPADVVHFVADAPADIANVTAVGTVTGPLSDDPFLLESTVGVRDFDFSLAGEWGSSLLSSLGKDPTAFREASEGMTGAGAADLRISLAAGRSAISGTMSSGAIRYREAALREIHASGHLEDSASGFRWGLRAEGELGEGRIRVEGSGEGGSAGISADLKEIDLQTVISLLDRDRGAVTEGRADLGIEASKGPSGWEIGKFSASVRSCSIAGLTMGGIVAEGSLGTASGSFSVVSASPSVRASGIIRREKGWPVSFSLKGAGVPVGMILRAIGREDRDSGGALDVLAEGTVNASEALEGNAIRPDALRDFRISLSATSPSAAGVSFDSIKAEGKKREDSFEGEIVTHGPDSMLSFSLSLRQPYAFRMEGPFTVGRSFGRASTEGDPGSAERGEGGGFSVAGRVRIAGSMTALDRSRGSLHVRTLAFRTGEVELTGENIEILLASDGIRWERGSLNTAGNPLHVSGTASWDGELDLRLDGTAPARAVRLATDVFDRLEGMIRMELRVTGKWDDPTVIGTGRLENGTFSFRKYAQLFEEMTADAVISREKIIFEHFDGRSGGGFLDGRGEVPLRFGEGQKMFFSVDFFDMRYPYPGDLRPVLQGHVELIGPVDDLLITGDVEVQSARYAKPVRPEQALLDFRKRLADVTARRQESDFRIRLDIEAVADGTIHVRNNLAEADIKGEFKVLGDSSRVIVLGVFDVTEGHVDYRGNRYELTRGALEFQDPRRNNPRLDFHAETHKGNVTVAVTVSGTLEKYEVELSSDPPLSKNDIVSLLSLGVTSESLSSAGGSVSAAEAAAIALGPYKGRVEEGIRNVIGLDKFAIEPSFSATDKALEPRFLVGKSFGDRFSVSVSTSVGAEAESTASAEWKVLENVYLQGAWTSATTTREGDLGADVKFRYRYREFRDIFRDGD